MDPYLEMKKFIHAATEYSSHQADSSASEVQKHLQVLESSIDVEFFDPSSQEAAHFYVVLHELISGLESRSMLVWSAIAVLHKACTNKKAKEALIHTYKFLPALTKFLSTNHISDKQLRLLQVLSEVTYGVKIAWQEAHLPQLIEKLIQIIMGNNKEHKAQALIVLVNLCYRNLPVLYVLMRKVELTKFMKCITKMNETPSIRMQVCKMLIIVEEIKGQLPDESILNFVDVAFNCVTDSFIRRDLSTLEQIVEFFKDVNENVHAHNIISRYPKAYEDSKRLLDLIENTAGSDESILPSMAVLLSFIPTAFKIKPTKISKLIPRLMTCTVPWVLQKQTCLPSLNIFLMVTELFASEVQPEISECVFSSLSTGLGILINMLTDEKVTLNTEVRKEELIGIFTLFAEMSISSPELRKQILESVHCNLVKEVLIDLLHQNSSKQKAVTKDSTNKVVVQILSFVSTLSTYSEDWMAVYMELLGMRQVVSSMALAILRGDKIRKYQVLRLVGSAGWGKESLTLLCEILNELQPDVHLEPSQARQPTFNTGEYIPSYNSETRINELLEHLHGLKTNEASTSAVMELYEYKLATMGHAERRLQAALEASDTRCIGLNHQGAQMRSEINRLNQMLFCMQQTTEGITAEKKDLLNQIETIRNENSHTRSLHSRKIIELTNKVGELELSLKERCLEVELRDTRLREEIAKCDQLTSALKDKSVECDRLNQALKEALTKGDDILKSKIVVEEALAKAGIDIKEYQAQIADFKAENEEIRNSLSQCMEKSSQKDDQLADCLKKISYLEQIREAVINVAARKEKF